MTLQADLRSSVDWLGVRRTNIVRVDELPSESRASELWMATAQSQRGGNVMGMRSGISGFSQAKPLILI